MFAMMEQALGVNQKYIEDDMSISVQQRCPECNSTNIVCHDPYNICMDCKTNLGTDIDYRPDWRNDANGEDQNRCNIARNEMFPESSMSTCIGMRGGYSKIGQELKRTLTWNSVPHSERSMRNKIEDIARVCRLNNIPDAIMEYAQENYHKLRMELEKLNMTRKRGNNDRGLKAAAVFISFQDNHKPKTYQEIAKIFEIDSRYVSAGIEMFNKLIRQHDVQDIKYSDYIDEFCDSLNMTAEHKIRVAFVADKAEELGILESNIPTSMVAGCISYVVAEFGLNIKANDIEERCNVSVATINKVCEKLNRRSVDLLDY